MQKREHIIGFWQRVWLDMTQWDSVKFTTSFIYAIGLALIFSAFGWDGLGWTNLFEALASGLAPLLLFAFGAFILTYLIYSILSVLASAIPMIIAAIFLGIILLMLIIIGPFVWLGSILPQPWGAIVSWIGYSFVFLGWSYIILSIFGISSSSKSPRRELL